MNPVREALFKLLKEDKALQELATGGVFHRKADEGVSPPYVVFFKSSGVPSWTWDEQPMDKDVWLVKGVGEASVAEDIDKRCKQLLNNTTLDIDGKEFFDLRQISDVDYDEIVDRERIDHVGAEYKLDSEYV